MKKIYLTFQLLLLTLLIKAQFCNPGFSNITVSSNTTCPNGLITCNATGGTLPSGAYYNWRAYYNSGASCNSGSSIDFGQQGSPLVVVNGSQFQMPATGQTTYYIRLTAVCSNGVRGCASSEIAVSRVGAPVITAPSTQVFFCPGTAASVAVNVTNGGTYTWTKDGAPVSGATTPTINFATPTATNAGVYRCIATNACGTTTSSAITFTTLGNQTIFGNPATQPNTTVSYQYSSNMATQGVTYNWTLSSGGTITSGANTYSAAINWGSTLGTHTISVLKTLATCSVTDTKTVSIQTCSNTPYTPSAIGLDFAPKICNGQNVTLYPNASGTFSWSTGEIQGAIIVTPSVTTTYSVQAFDGIGCLQSGTVQVQVIPLPTFTTNATNSSICAGLSSTLSITATNATDYSWDSPYTLNSNLVVTPTVTTNYGFQVFNTNQCSVSGVVTVSVSTCTGIIETEALSAITLQPNPAATYFTLNNVIEGTDVSIIDITGKTIAYVSSVNKKDKTITIETSNLSNGIYFIQLKNNGTIAHKKIIVSK